MRLKRPSATDAALRLARRSSYAEGGPAEGDIYGQDFNFETTTEINKPSKSQELTEYHPTWSDRIARLIYGDKPASPAKESFISGLMGTRGLGRTGIGVVDFTPPGMLLAAQEEASHGEYDKAAVNILPGAKPIGHVGKKAANILEGGMTNIVEGIQAQKQAATPSFLDISGFEKVGPQKGSNPGGVYADHDGQKWYVKTPKTEDHARNEILAAKLYELAGVNVPEIRLTAVGGKPAIASRIIEGEVLSKKDPIYESYSGLKENFPIDAWLGNWDAVGTGMDNVIVDAANAAHRIDMGGALRYRAQGSPKGEAFGVDVPELKDMLDPDISFDAAQVFKGADKYNVGVDAAARLDTVPDAEILKLVKEFGPVDAKDQDRLFETLVARKHIVTNSYLNQFGGDVSAQAPDAIAKLARGADEFAQDFNPKAEAFAKYVEDGDVSGMANIVYHTALNDVPEANKLLRSVPGILQDYVDAEVYSIGQKLGKHPFIEWREASSAKGQTLNKPDEFSQVPFTDVESITEHMVLNKGSAKDIAGAIWDAAVAGDMASAKKAKANLPTSMSSNVNKIIWGLKNKEKAHWATNVAKELFGKTPKGKNSELATKLISDEEKKHQAHMAKLEKQIKEQEALNYDYEYDNYLYESMTSDRVTTKKYFSNQAQASEEFNKIAEPIKDWTSWKPPVANLKLADIWTPKANPKKLKELGFNPNFKLYHSSPDPTLSVLQNPKDFNKGGEKALFASDDSAVAQSYHNFTYEFITRAPKAVELDWKKFTGQSNYNSNFMKHVIEAGHERGLDLIVLKNIIDISSQGSKKQNQYLFLNTHGTLRIPTANFDPEKLHLSHLSAGIAGGALFLYGSLEGQASESGGNDMPPKHAAGGVAGGSGLSPIRPRGMRLRPGLIKSGIPGRTDKIPARVPAGSYVIPADIVSGHGEGNTIAGAKALDRLFRVGPYNASLGQGIREPRVNYGRPGAFPKPRSPTRPLSPPKFANGGESDDGIEIIVAGGEYLLPPAVAERLGGGDISHGHDILDQFVLQSRQKIVDETRKLKGPKK